MHGRETAVSFDLPGLNDSFVVLEETGLALGVNCVVCVHVELVFVTLKWLHIKVLHRFQGFEDPFFIISWELGIAFEQIVFTNLLETFSQFEISSGP